MIRFEIGIVDTRNVLKAILDAYGYDFKDYALTSFKRRIELFVANEGLRDIDTLIGRLQQSKEYFERFLQAITPETTEMFRDPSLWRNLRDHILPELTKGTTRPKIWVAGFDSGEELYSLAITLKEINLLNEVQLYSSYISDFTLEKIKGGVTDIKQLEVNEANYSRLEGKGSFADYYKTANGVAYLDNQLIQGVNFVKQTPSFDQGPGGVKMVLFRNQSIYFNQLLTDRSINAMYNALVPGGYLILGIKESLENTNSNNKFAVVNESDQIYKKKTL